MEEFANYKVADLKRELKSRGLSTAGTKPELSTRLQAALVAEKAGMEDSSVIDDSLIDEDSMLEDEEDEESGSDVGSSNENSSDFPVNLSSPVKVSETKEPANILQSTNIIPSKLPADVAQNGSTVQSGVPPKKKKITINRLPVQTPAQPVAPVPTSEESSSPVKATTVEATGKTVVKISEVVSSTDKAKARLEKFGTASAIATEKVGATVPAAVVGDKLSKRAERFGTVTVTPTATTKGISKISLTPEDATKLAKRKERFGIQLANEKEAEVSAAKQKRSARFSGLATVTTPEMEERKNKRAARFATAT